MLTDTHALGKSEQQTLTYTRNANNLVTKLTDALGRVTEYQHDNNGNLKSDGVNTYTWNARDQLVSVTGANAATFTYV